MFAAKQVARNKIFMITILCFCLCKVGLLTSFPSHSGATLYCWLWRFASDIITSPRSRGGVIFSLQFVCVCVRVSVRLPVCLLAR